MTSSYHDLDNESLISLSKTHRRNLAALEQQAAEFGSLHVPVSITNQINDERQAIEAIKAELLSREYSSRPPNRREPQLPGEPSRSIFRDYRWSTLIIGGTMTLFILIASVALIVYLPGRSTATPPPTTTMPVSSNPFQITVLEVGRIHESPQIEVSWKDLPQIPNLYLMTSDGTRYYDPRPIQETSGQRKIPLNSGITIVVIALIPEGIILGEFPTNGVLLGDPSIPIEVKIQKSIPEQ